MRSRWGAILYIIAPLQYFLAQIIVASAWNPPYSWSKNYISDLGNTACGMFKLPHAMPSYVCSPYNLLMNISFVLSGVLLIAGTILLKRFWPQGKISTIGYVLLIVAGIGKCFVGFIPENTMLSLHTLAALNIPVGSLAILLLSIAVFCEQKALSITGYAAAIIGLLGTLFLGAAESGRTAALLGLGIGGMERLASYPMNLWMIVVGALVLYIASHSMRGSSGPR